MFRTPDQVKKRLDELIAKIVEIQGKHMDGKEPADVLVVSLHLALPAADANKVGSRLHTATYFAPLSRDG